ncbi:MAG: ORF6N domain-containing protein [archaeon]|nr:ORF6N domain-containing protein [archaeon]
MDRFPEDFMFELTKLEFDNLRSQIVTSSWGGTRYSPMANPCRQKPWINYP